MSNKRTKQKFYVVWQGIKPGIYDSWEACKKQVAGFDGAHFKSFTTKEEAKSAYKKSYWEIVARKGKKDLTELTGKDKPILNSISVDAACKGNPGPLEYRGVYTDTETPLFARGPFEMGTVNIGEFLALVLGMAWLKKNKINDMPIYSDSMTAMAWVRNKRVNTKLKKTAKNAVLFDALDKAVDWLKTNNPKYRVLKWKTKEWGAIPADSRRK